MNTAESKRVYRLMSLAKDSLQWSRRVNTAESRIACIGGIRAGIPSMEPPREHGGKLAARRSMMHLPGPFNGAAA